MPDENDETRTAPPPPPTGHYEPNLEPGLAAAFGEPTPGGWSQPPLLRDDPSEHAPLVQPGSPEVPRGGAERYQLLGEIARGGMGVVLKGRDPDLGRDLAFKVLRTELAGKPAAVQRFVEEAQVGGQLQHPGVVPVYDLGRFADGRPYFAMKLVKGRTLADLLAERASPATERGRYLHAFLQVCHTLAYAHSKGVIHRDLKPSNVMVGAFGEVLVMDWGLAKVLPRGGVADELKAQTRARAPVAEEPTVIHTARAGSGGSETQAGSVMGTPAFMPPEQAGGEIDKLDERADVFGLGAVLCVILTGAPPYVAETADATRLMAVRGELDECLARLGASGTDAELMDLCKRCLAPKREARPRHAGEVAGELAEYLAAVEQRAHAAEVERAAAAAEAREQRKRRKAQAVLGGLVTLVVLVGAATATWLWQRAEAERRNTREALDRLTEEQTRTLAALNAMTDEGIERLFQAQPEVSDEQRVFIDKVTALYEQATRANLETPAGRAARGDGLYRVGRLRARLDDHTGAERELRAAIEFQTGLLAEFPNNVEYRFALARSRSALAFALLRKGSSREAEAELRGALAEFRRVGEENVLPPGYLTELGRTQMTYAYNLNLLRNAEAVAQGRAGVQSLRLACERDPDTRTAVPLFLHASGTLSAYLSAPDESIRVLTEGLAFAEPYRARFGADQTFLRGYLLLRYNLSVRMA